MNKPPLVSIIIPLFNRIDFIEETLSSLKAQTLPDWEAIVVDDGSTDGSFELVSKLAKEDPRIQVHKRGKLPKGPSSCRNIGAEIAKANYLIFLDSDDLLAPFCVERRLQAFKNNPQCDFIPFAMFLFNRTPYDRLIYYNIYKKDDEFKSFISFDALWQTMGPIYKKEFFFDTGGFDESLKYREDYEFHMRVLTFKPNYINMLYKEPDCFLRRHEQASLSQHDTHEKNKLYIKAQVFLKILKILQNDSQNNWTKYYEVFIPMIMSISLEWVRYHQDLESALQVWQQYYEVGTLRDKDYYFGKKLIKVRHAKFQTSNLPSKMISKFYSVIQPKKFVIPENTLCKVKAVPLPAQTN